MGLYIFKMNDEEQPTQLITYTQHYIMGAVSVRMDGLMMDGWMDGWMVG